MNPQSKSVKPLLPTMLLLLGYAMIAFYLGRLLQYEFLGSDVLAYWQDSLAWQTPFNPFHVPAYPLMIAGARGITFGVVDPIVLMMGINLVAFVASSSLVFRIIQAGVTSDRFAAIGALLFGLWPFVGLTYAVYPTADMPAMFFFLAGLRLFQRSHESSAALLLGLSLVTHKAMWIFVGLLIISDLMYRKEYISKRNLLFVGITILPISILWMVGSFHHHSITWFLTSNLEAEVASKGDLLLLDGLLGTLMGGGKRGLVKGMLLLSFAFLSVLVLCASVRLRYHDFHYGRAISLAVLFLFIVLNQWEIWAAMRFGRLLAIPLVFVVDETTGLRKELRWSSPIIIVLLFLFLTQFAYAWYMARVYSG